jgi:hypothetical protein
MLQNITHFIGYKHIRVPLTGNDAVSTYLRVCAFNEKLGKDFRRSSVARLAPIDALASPRSLKQSRTLTRFRHRQFHKYMWHMNACQIARTQGV